jgi:hypothetical protein
VQSKQQQPAIKKASRADAATEVSQNGVTQKGGVAIPAVPSRRTPIQISVKISAVSVASKTLKQIPLPSLMIMVSYARKSFTQQAAAAAAADTESDQQIA